MDLRALTPRYHVSPQLTVEDMPAIAQAGFTMVICNRPDCEVPPEHQAEAIRAAAEMAGLRFEVIEISHQTLTAENVVLQRDLIEGADGKVLAYCRTGTRCSVIWAMGQLAHTDIADVMAQTAAAGYQLDSYLPLFEQVAQNPV